MFNCPRQEQYNKEHRTYKAWIYLANRFKNKSHQEMDSKAIILEGLDCIHKLIMELTEFSLCRANINNRVLLIHKSMLLHLN